MVPGIYFGLVRMRVFKLFWGEMILKHKRFRQQDAGTVRHPEIRGKGEKAVDVSVTAILPQIPGKITDRQAREIQQRYAGTLTMSLSQKHPQIIHRCTVRCTDDALQHATVLGNYIRDIFGVLMTVEMRGSVAV